MYVPHAWPAAQIFLNSKATESNCSRYPTLLAQQHAAKLPTTRSTQDRERHHHHRLSSTPRWRSNLQPKHFITPKLPSLYQDNPQHQNTHTSQLDRKVPNRSDGRKERKEKEQHSTETERTSCSASSISFPPCLS